MPNAPSRSPAPKAGARRPGAPTGGTIAFLAGGRLKTDRRAPGGAVRDRGPAHDGRGVAALDDGSLVFAAAPPAR